MTFLSNGPDSSVAKVSGYLQSTTFGIPSRPNKKLLRVKQNNKSDGTMFIWGLGPTQSSVSARRDPRWRPSACGKHRPTAGACPIHMVGIGAARRKRNNGQDQALERLAKSSYVTHVFLLPSGLLNCSNPWSWSLLPFAMKDPRPRNSLPLLRGKLSP